MPTVIPVTGITKLLGQQKSRHKSGKLFMDPGWAVKHFAETVVKTWASDSHRASTVQAEYEDENKTVLKIELVCDAAVGEQPTTKTPMQAH
jgi:hypothetical protein